MSHTNPSYDHDKDTISLGDLPSYKQYVLSPGLLGASVRRVSDHVVIDRSSDSKSIPPTSTTDNKDPDETLSGRRLSMAKQDDDDVTYDDNYYSLKHLRERRRGKRDEDADLSKRLKRFYRDQDEMIDVYERIHDHGNGVSSINNQHARRQKLSDILTKVSLAVNICLFILKIAGAVVSKSLSVVSSVIDSAVDLASSVILFWAWRAIKNRDKYRYPQGRTRLEPIAIVILSVIMCAASVLVIYESANTISDDAKYFSEKNTTRTLSEIDMSAFPISTCVVVVLCKAILFFLCHRVDTPTMSALAEDHRNDVASNIVALGCGLIGSFAYRQKINQKAIVVDPVGAICISLYIIFMWIRQANDQIKRLSGHTADPKFLSQITWLTYHHSQLISKIDTVRAFYFGSSYLVEVDIVLPEEMLLKEAHDIGEGLQKKIEALPEVERAFVHLDYEYHHNPSDEHKIV